MLILDYITILNSPRNCNKTYEERAKVFEALREMSKKMDVTIITAKADLRGKEIKK